MDAQRQTDITHVLCQKVVGQSAAMHCIVPYIQMFQAHLSPENRPAGVFLLLGPTGTGKTRTVEAVAETLHGGRLMLKIDCGEFQHDHEVAKLLGAPPGYIGHRETKPLLTQEQLEEVKSPNSDLSIVYSTRSKRRRRHSRACCLGSLTKECCAWATTVWRTSKSA